MKPIEYLAGIFFSLMQMQPKQTFFSTSLWLAEAIVDLDKKERINRGEKTDLNDYHLKKIEEIRVDTHPQLKIPLANAEAIVASTPMEKWKMAYEGKDNDGQIIKLDNIKQVNVLDIYRLLKESYRHSIKAVVDVIKDYSMEYRMSTGLSVAGEIPDWMGGSGGESEKNPLM
jgi:hypothetical protein